MSLKRLELLWQQRCGFQARDNGCAWRSIAARQIVIIMIA